MAYFITGDCHGDFRKIELFCKKNYHTNQEDTMIILGDAGINFYLNKKDRIRKQLLSELPITFFCIHGNHEERPYNIDTYKEKEWHEGLVYYEPEFPNILFAKDGEIYDFNGKKTIVIGGAYSVDKEYRILRGIPWFESEQPSKETKAYVEKQLKSFDWKIDYVFSHTCPRKYEPRELFLDCIDQSKVDKSTEQWLDDIESKLEYEKWYFGHYHGNKEMVHLEMLYEVIKELGKTEVLQRIGRPKYKIGEKVFFYFDNGKEKVECFGKVEVVDSYGSLEVSNEVSYDILGTDYRNLDEVALYKHIRESDMDLL